MFKKIRSRINEFWLLMAINNADVTPLSGVGGRPPRLRLSQSIVSNQGGQLQTRFSYLEGHFWLSVFIIKKLSHPIGIGIGIAGAARFFGWL